MSDRLGSCLIRSGSVGLDRNESCRLRPTSFGSAPGSRLPCSKRAHSGLGSDRIALERAGLSRFGPGRIGSIRVNLDPVGPSWIVLDRMGLGRFESELSPIGLDRIKPGRNNFGLDRAKPKRAQCGYFNANPQGAFAKRDRLESGGGSWARTGLARVGARLFCRTACAWGARSGSNCVGPGRVKLAWSRSDLISSGCIELDWLGPGRPGSAPARLACVGAAGGGLMNCARFGSRAMGYRGRA